MNGTLAERQALWDDFLARWPLEELPSLKLEQYSQPGEQDGFIYWLEARTEGLGSIWGGSAFKFGVYGRKDKTPKANGRGLCYDDSYGWLAKHGKTPQEAFEKVRQEILRIAQAARAGQLDQVDAADMGDAVKWKIAFLYQNQEAPCVLPIFKTEYLQLALGSKERKVSVLHRRLMEDRGDKDVQTYGDVIWEKVQAKLNTDLSVQEARDYFESSGRFHAVKPATQKIAGYESVDGLQIALALDNQRTTLYLETGPWLPAVRGQLQSVDTYSADRPRSSSLAANTPRLAVGNPIVKTVVPTMAALIALSDAYCNTDESEIPPSAMPMLTANSASTPLNQVLYGPPGTGKTYATIEAALAIVASDFIAAHAVIPPDLAGQRARRQALKKHFDEIVDAGRIRFVTFHQSFSYEDFVEGLRAQTNGDNQVEYKVEDGVFKQLCDAARTYATRQSRPEIASNPRIWKISIDSTGVSSTRQYCLDKGEARIGWGDTGDLTQLESSNTYFESLGSNDKSTLGAFSGEIAEGDILVCIHSAMDIGAVGVVRGPYRFEKKPPAGVRVDYKHVLPVDWLYRDLAVSVLPINDNKRFTLKAVYPLDRFSWGDLLTHLEKAGAQPLLAAAPSSSTNEPHVLVIDEINRGNVSRIFGELITLIEPSKRDGQAEALSALLPYSKRRFSVPDNVYIIGTMNTADRSLAGLDIALRRRFDFVEMLPQPDLLDGVTVDGINVGQLLRVMNQRIELLLDRDHCMGHAYFMPLLEKPELTELARIFRGNVLPLLQEYFFEDWQRIQWVLNDHRKPSAQRFLSRPTTNFAEIFGEGVNVNDQGLRWVVNKAAFNMPEAYAGVIFAAGDGKA